MRKANHDDDDDNNNNNKNNDNNNTNGRWTVLKGVQENGSSRHCWQLLPRRCSSLADVPQ